MSCLKVGVFTGNRAEYGLLKPLISAIRADPDLELLLFVGGALLNDKYGKGLDAITDDGFEITRTIKIPEPGTSGVSTAGAIAAAITQCEAAFLEYDMDGIIVYADRYEGFAAVIAASHSNIPVFHIEGGDITQGGAFDDNVRHAMTKLSHLHFATNSLACEVLREMGEEDWRIENVGLMSLATLSSDDLLSPNALQEALGIPIKEKLVIFTLHSISSSNNQTQNEADAAFAALRSILLEESVTLILTYPNDDNGSDIVIKEIRQLKHDFPEVEVIPSLGQKRYFSILNLRRHGYDVICMGNTSSIVKECIFFGVPGILIGTRQTGRLIPGNVRTTPANKESILESYLDRDNIINPRSRLENPYCVEHGVNQALEHIKRYGRDPRLFKKVFNR
ncbi:UDP-N-acetylglucosamine 2-epimerase [Parasphingorhabdus sp.]|uniref:UDP-N-acetylglucosamine 2-epimerase n=1 Tax=Parasphingorhabdus sp. TaxID=2709688 RepID=UPI0032EF57A0